MSKVEVPVICRVKRRWYDYGTGKTMYELEPIVLPQTEKKELEESRSR